MEKLLKILSEIVPDVDFETEENLVDDGLIDSFDIVSIISELTDVFGITIPVEEIEAENFNSAKSIQSLINKLLSK